MAKAVKRVIEDENLIEDKAEIETPEMEEPAEDLAPAKADDIVDVEISAIKKKKFRINGDNNLIIELNTSDMNILKRLKEADPKFDALEKKVAEISLLKKDEMTPAEVTKALVEIDSQMKELVDYIFDSPIAEKCAEGGSMYDVFNGQFRYEHIVDKFMGLYADNLNREYKLMKRRVNKYAKR